VYACSDACATLQDTRCNGNIVQSCELAANGCTAWIDASDCGAIGQVCEDAGGGAACESLCSDPCTPISAARCAGSVVQVCTVGGDGCTFWSDDTDCADTGRACQESGGTAQCVLTCQDDCTSLGDTRCLGAVVQTCALEADGCARWANGEDCAASGQACESTGGEAGCVPVCDDECTPEGATRCSGTLIQTCAVGAEGCTLWLAGIDCADDGQLCDDAYGGAVCVLACSDACAQEGAARCSGARIQTCGPGPEGCLAWIDGTDCAATGEVCAESNGSASCESSGGDLCDPCAAHADCAGYTGQYGGIFCQPLYQGGTDLYCLQDCTNDAGLCQPGENCDGLGNCIPPQACGQEACSPANPDGTCPDGMTCEDGTCVTVDPGDAAVGGACGADEDCVDAGAQCYPQESQGEETGFLDGYCLIFDCSAGACPSGSTCVELSSGTVCLDLCGSSADCRPGYGCLSAGEGVSVCFPYCTGDGGCPGDTVCVDGRCRAACTPGSCPAGEECVDGRCVVDVGDGPGVNTDFPLDQLDQLCPDLPPLECTGSAAWCGELVPFDPDYGPGYVDYPENGETWDNQYRSWIRRDNMMMIKYACAYVDCLADDWSVGNGEPLGLIDMSEADGAIPGTSVGSPGHPQGTHVNGYDIDVSYYQVGTPDNQARPICEHYENGQEAYHCTETPHLLDSWRTALFLGALQEHPYLRVVGADGKAGPILEAAMAQLCADGWIRPAACANDRLTFEETDTGMGWFYFHHHHMHISLSQPDYDRSASPRPAITDLRDRCLVPGCALEPLRMFLENRGIVKQE
jgi:hypothetical protein